MNVSLKFAQFDMLKMHIFIILSIFSAKYCDSPPNPPESGRANILNSGMSYGTICQGTEGWTDMTGTNSSGSCGVTQILRTSISVQTILITDYIVAKYDILINAPNPPVTLKALLAFSQPIDSDKISISRSGPVGLCIKLI